MPRDDLQVVNHALSELSRLQLSADLDPETAWQQRRDMLRCVEANWALIPEDAAAEAAEAVVAEPAAAVSIPSPHRLSGLRRWWHRLNPVMLRDAWVLTGWGLLLAAAATFIYVMML